jgi:light-regulated signal transduction histidine kinase (bacteriophytochrome)
MAEGELLEVLNLTKEGMEGKTLRDLPLNKEVFDHLIKNFEAGLEGKSGKFEFESAKGGFYYNVIVQPLIQPNKKIDEVLIIAYDIFEQKKMALQLQQNLHQLQDNVKVLQQKNDQLEQFAYISSHDLQEPLRMVVLYTQLLEQKFARNIDLEAKEFISFAREGAQRMQQIIYDLLFYNDLDNNRHYLQKINANMALRSAMYKLQPQIDATKARITSDTLPEISVDAKEFVMLLEHLLVNAMKFVQSKTIPQIHVTVKQDDNEWIFSVKDNGIGIQESHYSRIFNIFQRLHSRNEYKGSGIGLAICKKIVNLHGGNIWVESSENGSTFFFSLPKPAQQ